MLGQQRPPFIHSPKPSEPPRDGYQLSIIMKSNQWRIAIETDGVNHHGSKAHNGRILQTFIGLIAMDKELSWIDMEHIGWLSFYKGHLTSRKYRGGSVWTHTRIDISRQKSRERSPEFRRERYVPLHRQLIAFLDKSLSIAITWYVRCVPLIHDDWRRLLQ